MKSHFIIIKYKSKLAIESLNNFVEQGGVSTRLSKKIQTVIKNDANKKQMT